MKIEVCVTSAAGARMAEGAGVDRLELCAELAVGGITPSIGLLEAVRDAVQLPVHVLIRPRSGDFVYADEVVDQMLRDIEYCQRIGYDGFAIGCLLPDGKLHMDHMELLARAVGTSHLTFHRAFDRLEDWESALPSLETLGVDTILSSGQSASALEGLSLLRRLPHLTRCGIMPGGGIRPENVDHFKEAGFEAIHLSGIARPKEESVAGPFLNTPSLLREGRPLSLDPNLLERLVARLKTT